MCVRPSVKVNSKVKLPSMVGAGSTISDCEAFLCHAGVSPRFAVSPFHQASPRQDRQRDNQPQQQQFAIRVMIQQQYKLFVGWTRSYSSTAGSSHAPPRPAPDNRTMPSNSIAGFGMCSENDPQSQSDGFSACHVHGNERDFLVTGVGRPHAPTPSLRVAAQCWLQQLNNMGGEVVGLERVCCRQQQGARLASTLTCCSYPVAHEGKIIYSQ